MNGSSPRHAEPTLTPANIRRPGSVSVTNTASCWADDEVAVAVSTLLLLATCVGWAKAVIGATCYPSVGSWGLRLFSVHHRIPCYYERWLHEWPVEYSPDGEAVHPISMQRSVRTMSGRTQFILNLLFGFYAPFVTIHLAYVHSQARLRHSLWVKHRRRLLFCSDAVLGPQARHRLLYGDSNMPPPHSTDRVETALLLPRTTPSVLLRTKQPRPLQIGCLLPEASLGLSRCHEPKTDIGGDQRHNDKSTAQPLAMRQHLAGLPTSALPPGIESALARYKLSKQRLQRYTQLPFPVAEPAPGATLAVNTKVVKEQVTQ